MNQASRIRLRKLALCAVLFAFLPKLSLAQDPSGDSTAPTGVIRSRSEAPKPSEARYPSAVLRPSIGEMFFDDQDELVGGLLADLSAVQTPILHLSISTGVLYSGLGSSVSPSIPSGASVLQIPADLKLTIQPDPERRLDIGPHLGVNFIRSSGGLAQPFGSSTMLATRAGGSSSWDAHISAGGDVAYALTRRFDIALRYDVSFFSAFKAETLTIGLGWFV